MKVLVVDDDVDILEAVEMTLESVGYETYALDEGENIVDEVISYKPDLIILDVLISGKDGRTICKELKDYSKTKDIPVIMMSAHPSAKETSYKCGADDFIAKPFDIDDLLDCIKKNI